MRHHLRTQSVLPGFSLLLAWALSAWAPVGYGAELDLRKMFREGIPKSPFIGVVYRYADTMLAHGRDTYGPRKTGLPLSALDRETLAPLTVRPAAPTGVAEENRPGPRGKPLVGANPQRDQNLLRLLYFLVRLSGEERYGQAADEALKWFLQNTQSPDTGLLPWGEHLSWNVMTDEVASGLSEPTHELARPWMLWDRCFQLAPQQSKRFALGLWENHVVDRNTGAFDRRARFDRRAARPAAESARHAGFFIRTWAEAYAHTKDKTFLTAIDAALAHCRRAGDPKAKSTASACCGNDSGSALSLAIDCAGAAGKVPEPLRTRLARFADRQDRAFCALPHDLKGKQGFLVRLGSGPSGRNSAYTPLWEPPGSSSTAAAAMMCVSRYENGGRAAYRDLIVAAADAYLDSLPGDQVDAWPMTFGHVISLELAAFRATADGKYHARAVRLGEIAVEEFFGRRPLPRASLKTDHYEDTTGADTLVLALAELHLSTLGITAVRAPANTIDR